jgi:multisubunit Na+/H+ antiporter MnhF subunit
MEQTAIIDVALMLGILAVFASVGFVTWRSDGND